MWLSLHILCAAQAILSQVSLSLLQESSSLSCLTSCSHCLCQQALSTTCALSVTDEYFTQYTFLQGSDSRFTSQGLSPQPQFPLFVLSTTSWIFNIKKFTRGLTANDTMNNSGNPNASPNGENPTVDVVNNREPILRHVTTLPRQYTWALPCWLEKLIWLKLTSAYCIMTFRISEAGLEKLKIKSHSTEDTTRPVPANVIELEKAAESWV